MEDIKALLIGIVGTFIAIGLQKLYRSFQQKNIKQNIEDIEFEKNQLQEMKHSNFEMLRSAFSGIYFMLMLVGVAEVAPIFAATVKNQNISVTQYISLTAWALIVALAYKFWKRFSCLKKYEETMEQLEEKLTKLKSNN